MRSSAEKFAEFARATLQDDPLLYPVIVKEVIHIEALSAMAEVGLFQQMVFQGGTAIRLCYGGRRYSEDLDFSADDDFAPERMNTFFECLYDRTSSLGLQMDPIDHVLVKDFRDVGGSRSWRSRIVIPAPSENRPDVRSSHFVKVEVDDRKVYERTVRPVQVRHSDLGQIGSVVATKSTNELVADKTLAFIGRKTMKWRDVFDIYFLRSQSANFVDPLLISKFDNNYQSLETIQRLISIRREDLNDPRKKDGLPMEMSPLLPMSERNSWLSDEGTEAFRNEALSILDRVSECLEL